LNARGITAEPEIRKPRHGFYRGRSCIKPNHEESSFQLLRKERGVTKAWKIEGFEARVGARKTSVKTFVEG